MGKPRIRYVGIGLWLCELEGNGGYGNSPAWAYASYHWLITGESIGG